MAFDYSRRIIQDLAGVEVSYGEFLFPPALNISVQGRPIMDSSQRHNKLIELTVRIEGILSEADSTLTYSIDIKDSILGRLNRSGLPLKISGYGGLDKLFSHTSDLNFGPHPKMVSWKPLGNNCCYFVWECVTTAVTCPFGDTGSIGEFSWSVGFAISSDGTTTRTIMGQIEVFTKRLAEGSSGTTTSFPDIRANISFPRIPNFHRESVWGQSADKRIMHFKITDTEIKSDVPFHPGMVNMKVSESLSSSQEQGALYAWDVEISGTIEIAAGLPRILAWLAFLAVVQSRQQAAQEYNSTLPDKSGTKPVTIIHPRFRLTNEIYGRSLSFMMGWTLTASPDVVLQASGMWRPVPGTNWQQWSASMASLQGNFGIANLRTNPSDDIIVDYCTPINTSSSSPTTHIPGLQFSAQKILDPGCPVVWLRFENQLTLSRSPNVSAHYVYAPEMDDATIQSNPLGLTSNKGGTISGTTSRYVVQDRGVGTAFLILRGWAVRQAGEIPIPKIKTIGGKLAILHTEKITPSTRIMYSTNGCPIYGAKWERIYYLPSGVGSEIVLDDIPEGQKL